MKVRSNLLFIFGMLVFTSIPSFASDDFSKLAQHPRWLILVQYEKSLFGGYISRVRSPSFFFAKEGARDPEAELKATVHSFYLPVPDEPESHARCRFPARLRWLSKMGAVDLVKVPQVECKNFDLFSLKNQVESISLVFATGYLSNPASFFGHPLVKFNFPRSKIPTNLLDTSVNYGAITPADENPVVYAAKGLFGGYDATFTNRQFYYNNHAYGELELRDMWEYKLNLTPDEVSSVVAQLWEFMGQFFPYYFFSDNCATAVAQLIGDETGTELMSPYLPYGLPYTLFDRLMEAKRSNGAPLVSSVTLLPSRQTRLTSRFHALDQDQQAAVKAVTRSNTLTEEYSRLAPEKRGPVIEALFDYYSFRSVGGKEAEVFKETKRKLVMDRLQLPPSNSVDLQLPNLRPAHEGQRPFLTRLTGFDSAHFGRGFEFQFRTSYYDFLAPEFGRPKNTSVRTLDTALNFADQKIWVRRLELFGVETLNLSQTGLPGDGGFAWKFNMGFETLNLQCHNCSIFKIEGGLGQGFTPFSGQVLLFMIDGRVQSVADGSGHLGVTPNVSYWVEPIASGIWKVGASMGFREYVDDKQKGEVMARFENRFGLSRNWDVRAGYEKHVDHRWNLSVSGYW